MIEGVSGAQRFPHPRHRRMAELIAVRGSLTIADLCAHFEISAPTIRRDLGVLERAGLAARTHGGVVAPGTHGAVEPLFLEKLRVHGSLKTRIGEAAARHVRDGETVLLDSGTTALALARALAGRPVGIVAMDLKVAEAAASGATDVGILGGHVRNGYYSIVGDAALGALAALRCDTFFMGADAIDPDGVSNSTVGEAEVKRAAIASARRTVLMADHSKLGARADVPVCDLGAFERLITDRRAEPRLAPYRGRIARIELR